MNESVLPVSRPYQVLLNPRAWLRSARAISTSQLIRQIMATYVTQILRVGLGLAMTVMIARILGPEGRGLYAVALTVAALGVQFGSFGLGSASIYYVAKHRKLLSLLVGNALLVSFVVGGVGAAVTWLLFDLWPKLAPLHGAPLTLALLVIPFSLGYSLLQSLLLGLLDVTAYNTIELANKVLALVLVVMLWAVRLTSVEAMLIGFVVAQVATFAWLLRRVETLAAPSRPGLSLSLLREQTGVALRAYLAMFFSFLVLRVDLLMVQYMLGAERAGQYSVASSMADYVTMLPVVTGTILFPKLSGMGNTAEKLRLASRAVLLIGALLLPVIIVATLLARPMVAWLFGAEFLPAAQAFVWLAPGIFFIGLECVAVQFLNSMGYPLSVVITWVACVVVKVAINLWAIPAYGIVGASLNSSFVYTLAAVLIFWITWRTGRRAPAVVLTQS